MKRRSIRQVLVNTVSTNGRVEPEENYEFYSPIATTVKAVYVQPGDKVPAGKLLMVLDDVQARARLATAESGVKAAQAAVDAATHNGTQEQRQMAAGDIARARLDRDQARRDLDALIKLQSDGRGLGQRGGGRATTAGYSRSQPARIRAERQQPLLAGRGGAGAGSACRRRGRSGGGTPGGGANLHPCSRGRNGL